MPRVGDDEPALINEHPGGQVHPLLGAASPGGRPLGLSVGLPEHHIGGLLVVLGHAVPDQHPVVAGVGHHQVLGAQEHPARGVHPRH